MEVITIFLVVLIVLNLVASIFIMFRDDLEKVQKSVQIIIIWFVPFIAAIGLLIFHITNDKPTTPKGPIGGGAGDGPTGMSGPND